jgi:tetratricopeptide (TPR) repeat protein
MSPEVGMTPAGDGQKTIAPTEASFVRLAEAYRKEGLLEDAIRICRDGLGRFPASWPGRLVLGKILLEQGAVEEAYDELEHVRREARGRPEVLAALEETLKGAPGAGGEKARPAEPDVLALDLPGDAVSQAPSRDPLASATLAKLYASQGDTAKAEAILSQLGREDRAGGEAAEHQARERYLERLSTLRSVVQRERRSRPS